MNPNQPEHPSKIHAWIEAMRLRTLPVSVAGVIAGTACATAAGNFRLLPALICLTFALVAQIVSNFANEYYDYRNGFDRKGREGFRRGVTEGDITPRAMLRATYALLAADALLGCSLIYYGGWWLIAAGAAIAVFAIAYSAGPYPLSHHGLGDIAVVIFFGIVPVMLTCYVQAGGWEGWRLSLPVSAGVGILAANVLIVNNYRDVADDRAVGKRTTVVIFGRRAMSWVYIAGAVAAVGLIFLPFEQTVSASLPVYLRVIIPLFFTAVYIFIWTRLRSLDGSRLNPLLGATAMSLLAVSVTLLILAVATL